jgi:hypothetical protein
VIWCMCREPARTMNQQAIDAAIAHLCMMSSGTVASRLSRAVSDFFRATEASSCVNSLFSLQVWQSVDQVDFKA